LLDVLLIQPPIEDFYFTAKRSVPYGLACLAATLMQKGYSVRVLDGLASAKARRRRTPDSMAYLLPYYGRPDHSPFASFNVYRHFGYSVDHLQRQIAEARPSVIGISSSFSAYSDQALAMARAARACLSGAVIVMGGHHPTALPRQVLACSAVDFVLRGEGETSLPALVGALRDGTDIDSVPGIAYRLPTGKIHLSDPAVIESLDRMPPPAHALIDFHFYKRAGGASTTVVASRGCPMQCSYCSLAGAPAVPYRRRSVDSVLQEIDRAVHRHGVRFIDFEDENISLERSWFLELLLRLESDFAGFGLELRAMNGLFPPSLDDTVIRLMQAAGFKALNLSLGSISPAQLKRFRRPDVRVSFENALASARQLGLDVVAYVIGGAPFQTARDTLNDLLYVAGTGALAALSVYYPSPGSRDFDRIRALNLLPSDPALWRASALPISHTTSRLELATLVRLTRILNFVKALHDKHISLPRPQAYAGQELSRRADRTEVGRRLLAWFLCDGIIRGVDAGQVYAHAQSPTLAEAVAHWLNQKLSTAGGLQRHSS
jgi:radical SAM superfamily enzyme YgiQ (UPF0313 family)